MFYQIQMRWGIEDKNKNKVNNQIDPYKYEILIN